jgi:hypothetical protein
VISSTEPAHAALLRRRRQNRTAKIEPFDAFYRAYVTALIAGMAVLAASGWLGDERASVASRVLAHDGAAVLAVVSAVAIAAGLRSGARGGPFAVEAPDVRHVLLAPVDRGSALRNAALRQLRFLAGSAAAGGATAGILASHRLDGGALAWTATGAVYAVATLSVSLGAAWCASGARLAPPLATLVSAVLVTASVLAARADVPGPTTPLGRLAVLPLRNDSLLVGAVALAAGVLLAGGARLLERSSVERLSRRSSLIGELRFAATMRDLRTVMVLRRQLTQERPRSRPWVRVRGVGSLPPVIRRDVRALVRLPPSRAVRLAGAIGVAAVCGVGVWHGTTALAVLGGLAGFVAGLELLEPLAQDLDHPHLLDLAPVPKGPVHAMHLIVPSVVLVACALAVAVPLGATMGGDAPPVAALFAVSVAVASVAGAAGSILRDSDPGSLAIDELMLPPEAMGMRLLYKTVWPPALAALGYLPVIMARSAAASGSDPVGAATTATLLVLSGAAAFSWWVRSRDSLKTSWAQATAAAPGSGG